MTGRMATVSGLALMVASATAGCGARARTPEQQIRSVETRVVEGLVSDHPQAACKYSDDPSTCLGWIVMTKAIRLDVGSLVPNDWRGRIAAARVTVAGQQATMDSIIGDEPARFKKHSDGRGYVVVTSDNGAQ
jgi:hypothetical protein